MSEFMSHDEALAELSLTSDELNDLVARGELRAFRDGDDVRFKSEDITAMKKSRETEPTIVLSDTDEDSLSSFLEEEPIDLDSISTDETVLNIEGLLEDEAEGTTPIPGADTLSLEDDDEIQIGSIGEDTVLDTDGIDLDDDFDFSDDDTLLDADEETLLAGASAPRQVQMVRKQSHAGWTVAVAATMIMLLLPLAVLSNLMATPDGVYPEWVKDMGFQSLNGLIEGILGLF